MAISFATEAIPIEADASGVLRIGKTRVTLDTVIAAFSNGATPEEIVQQYPTLNLADVYYVIGYYLRRPPEVETYLHKERLKRMRYARKMRPALTLRVCAPSHGSLCRPSNLDHAFAGR